MRSSSTMASGLQRFAKKDVIGKIFYFLTEFRGVKTGVGALAPTFSGCNSIFTFYIFPQKKLPEKTLIHLCSKSFENDAVARTDKQSSKIIPVVSNQDPLLESPFGAPGITRM